MFENGFDDSSNFASKALRNCLDPVGSRFSPPAVAAHVVKLACERPDVAGRSLSQWDCLEIARQLVLDGLVESIGRETVRRILSENKLKPWRFKMWLSSKVPRDAAFAARIQALCDLYTRPLAAHELVLSLDEKTSLQPRPRTAPTRPTGPCLPTQVEHEYRRAGALNLIAAFDTRSGKVYGITAPRKRQVEFIILLEKLDAEIPGTVTRVYFVLDNVSMHKGKLVQAWLKKHPRFELHLTPVHCSWLNQIEQWFSILQRKRFQIVDFESKEHLAARLAAFIMEWNQFAHPFKWTTKSFDKILAKCQLAPVARENIVTLPVTKSEEAA